MSAETFTSKVKRGAHVMLVSIMAGANIATIILMWATCLSTLLPPAVHPRLSQAGLLFPVFACRQHSRAGEESMFFGNLCRSFAVCYHMNFDHKIILS